MALRNKFDLRFLFFSANDGIFVILYIFRITYLSRGFMTKLKGISLFALIFSFTALILASEVAAQPIELEPLKVKSTSRPTEKRTSPKPARINRRENSTALLKQVAPKRPKAPTIKTSDLAIVTTPNATVVMTPIPLGRGATKKEIIADADGRAEFDDLRAGRYKISAKKDEYIEQESEVNIGAQASLTLDFPLEPIEYQLNFATNISEGEVRYAPARLVGDKTAKPLRLEPDGNYCIVQIKNNRAAITGLTKDYYTLQITPSASAIEFEPLQAAIEPEDIVDEKDETENLKIIDIELDKKISDKPFDGSSWTSNEWQVPTGWKLQNSMMSTSGVTGLAMPRNEQYRYYTNFELTTDVILSDRNTVGFAVRMENPNNYYLIQITGERAAEKNKLIGSIVKNGVLQPLVSVNIPFDSIINSRRSFRMMITGTDNVFKVCLEVKGRCEPLGEITDRDKNFKKGAVGIVSLNNSDFGIGTFVVNPLPKR